MAFVKDMLRMWAHSWKRFISIAMITLLGVAVLTGIYAGCRDAFRSTDRFFDAQGLHDVQVLSTAGLVERRYRRVAQGERCCESAGGTVAGSDVRFGRPQVGDHAGNRHERH